MLGLMELGALGLAAARVTQLIVFDTILDGARQRLELWHARKFTSKVRTFVRQLIACPYCTGWHAAWLTVLTYRLASGQGPGNFLVFGIESFAVAGIQMIANNLDDYLALNRPKSDV